MVNVCPLCALSPASAWILSKKEEEELIGTIVNMGRAGLNMLRQLKFTWG